MKRKQFLAGLLTIAMVGVSLALPGNALQAEAASKAVKKITIPKKATVYIGVKKTLKVTKAPKAASAKISWKSSDKKVASVNSKGVVKGLKAGKATITASVKGQSNISSSCKVTVKKPRKIKNLKTDSARVTLNAGGTKTVKTTITPKNASIKKLKYKSSNTAVASVSSKGKITAKKAGSAVITVSATDGSRKKATIQVTVNAAAPQQQIKVSKITAKQSDFTLNIGTKQKLETTVAPANAANKQLRYTLSDPNAASVSADGTITALAQGSTDITVEAADGSGVKTVVHVTVVNTDKTRTIVTTDGEVDDMDSFMRLMLYSNEMDIAGLVLSSSTYHYAGDPEKNIEPYRWTGTQWAYDVMEDYAEVYDNLKIHAGGYPTPAYLNSILKIGNIKNVGEMEEVTEGSEFIKDILLDNDERTVYIQTWGGTNTTARALKSIEEKYKDTDQWDAVYKKVCDKAVIYIILSQDSTYSDYIQKSWPDIKAIHDQGTFWRFAYMWKSVPSELTTKLSGQWFSKNILRNHGPLLANYKTMGDGTILEGELDSEQRGVESRIGGTTGYDRYDFISEGDSPSFFYLLDTGLRSLEDPTYGGWGGRFGIDTDGTFRNIVKDYSPYANGGNGGEDTYYALTRWFDDIQNDFGARADWCVADRYEKANHRPAAEVTTGLDITAIPGESVMMNVKATDPDGDNLDYKWWQYYEADTYNGSLDGKIEIKGASSDKASFVVPEDAKAGDTIHMVVEVSDDGAHNMKHYQRVILTVKEDTTPRIPVSAIKVNADSTTVTAGSTLSVTADITPENATDTRITWSSDDETVATVTSGRRGYTINGISAGKTTIRATSDSSPDVSGSLEVTVTRNANDPANLKTRTIVTTDGEVDDMDSFMRLMLYSNEMDIAGLVLSSSTYHYAGDPEKDIAPYRWTGTQWAYDVLDDYAEVYDNLKIHADGYPTPSYLKSILKVGNIKNVGEMEEVTEGSEFIKDILLDDDERTTYIQTWGGTNTTARALKSIEEQYKGTDQWDAIYKKVCDKAVIYIILSQDSTYSDYIQKNWPGIRAIHDQGTFWRFAYMWKSVPEQLTSKLSGKWFYKNILKNHGPLLANYKTMGDGTTLEGELDNEQRGWENRIGGTTGYDRYDFISEGDSPSFFYLLDTGLRSLEDPTYGGWGGRFGIDTDGTFRNIVSDYSPYANSGSGGTDSTYTLTRWFNDIQNDFGARADWCVADSYEKANHRPTAEVTTGLDVTAKPGETVTMSTTATDPDGDDLEYKWWQYYEADTYNGSLDGNIAIKGASSDRASFTVPEDAKNGDTIHMVVEVWDDGVHNMKHYQRVIITVAGREELGTLSLSLPEDVQDNTIEFGEPSQGWGGPSYSSYAKQLTILSNGSETPEFKTFTWESSDTSIATVNSSGQVTPAGSSGTVTITATANDGSGKSITIELTLSDTRTSAGTISEAKDTAEVSSAGMQTAEDSQTGGNPIDDNSGNGNAGTQDDPKDISSGNNAASDD